MFVGVGFNICKLAERPRAIPEDDRVLWHRHNSKVTLVNIGSVCTSRNVCNSVPVYGQSMEEVCGHISLAWS